MIKKDSGRIPDRSLTSRDKSCNDKRDWILRSSRRMTKAMVRPEDDRK